MSKKRTNKKSIIPTADDYTDYDDRTHVYEKAEMYVGSPSKLIREDWLYDLDTKIMKFREIDFSPACERIFLEILSNASDHCIKSKKNNIDHGSITIMMNKHVISIKNQGLPIPIEKWNNSDMWLPQKIFGQLRTSSHYEEEERHSVGVNGIGSKATNIFSKNFKVIIENATVNKKYTQIWEDNMKICHPPTIVPYKGTVSTVFIEYHMDFEKFGYTEYPQEAFELFARHAADTSFNAKVKVVFNNITFDYQDIQDYGKLYFNDTNHSINNSIVIKQDHYELLIVDTPDSGQHVSFVNCMMTKDGGVHVNAVYKAVGDPVVAMINEHVEKKLDKFNVDERDRKAHLVNLRDLKPHMSILLSCRLVNPEFTGQCKSFLNKPIPKIDIDLDLLQPMVDWTLVKRLYAALDAKHAFNLTKTDGKMSWNVDIDIDGYRDAAFAGTPSKSAQCILCATEGKSGAGYVNEYISIIENGSSYYGVLPLRGKCLNVLKADSKQLEKNKEIRSLKTALGLKENTDYTDPNHFKKLRYGKFMICADSDLDGKHITGLILNIFHCRFPSLLKVPNFIVYKRTPILRMSKAKKTVKFYARREYDVWLNKQKGLSQDHGWKPKYYKGLATSSTNDIKDDINDEKIVNCQFDADASASLMLAFDPKLRDERKKWILDYKERDDVDSLINQPISLFINHELILFSKADNVRSIPKWDGFKDSHRKIIAGAHKYFHIGNVNKNYDEIKVVDLASFVSLNMNYHHGNDSLCKAITLMAQDFVGANNINLFEPIGQFGTRLNNGDDAGSPRYIHTHPSILLPYIFVEDDQDLLIPMIDEGKTIEPETYLPIIPNILVNGTKGIGTGYSSSIPCHNPIDIVNWLRGRLTGHVDLPNIKPWYRGFTGQIVIIDRRKNKDKLENDDDDDDEIFDHVNDQHDDDHSDNDDKHDDDYDDYNYKNKPNHPLLSFVVMGTYHVGKNGNVVITELPIGLSPVRYLNKFVKKLLVEKKIKKYIDKSDADKIYFELKGFKDTPSYKTLGLRRRYSLSNMFLLNKDNIPIKYDTANDIMETFYNERLPYFTKRKQNKLEKIQLQINKLNDIVKFNNAIINKDLLIQNVSKQMIYEKLKQLGIPSSVYDHAKLSDISKEDIVSMSYKIDTLQKEYTKLSKTTPSELWLTDLKIFENKYKSMFN
ncbi:MAG TPA: DNA gyrase subunit A [Candidatus Saccharimonadales bacterium]|nr:DNA gyrase subunit A [Candidatus Saccharimonadales bacterium]